MNTATLPLPLSGAVPPRSATPLASHPPKDSFWDRYRVIILAVTLFIVIDLGVLVLNFYTSFQIAEDATSVNLAGRQRMLSQRMTKALLTLELQQRDGLNSQAAQQELQKAVTLFHTTLRAFEQGGTVPGGDGKAVHLPAASGEAALAALRQASTVWGPYEQALAPVLAGRASAAELVAAVTYASHNNVQLLGQMNDLTTALETNASQRATHLRLVQAAGIVLALLNFAYILYKFLSSLRRADAAILSANRENAEILTSVREGLCLVQPDMCLGQQISSSMAGLLGRPVRPGDHLIDTLRPLLFDKDLADAQDYLDLLFAPHVKESLVQSINPLATVAIKHTDARGQLQPRHLSFSFNRVMQEGNVKHLLITVQDISPRILLELQLDAERRRARKEFSALIQALQTDSAVLRSFVERAESQLLQVNDLLRSVSHTSNSLQLRKTVDHIFRLVHTLKGDATSLDMELIADLAHSFEDALQRLRDQPDISGETLLNLPLPLKDLLDKVSTLRQVTQTAPAHTRTATPAEPATPLEAQLASLARKVADSTGKQVITACLIRWPDHPHSDHLRRPVSDMAVQLVRNAVAHGIEAPEQRLARGKPAQGVVRVEVTPTPDEQGLELRVRDDGCGLDPQRLRQRLAELTWYTPEQLADLSDKQVISHIFKPGFSTSDGATEHAGRGVGLDAVQAMLAELDGHLRIQSTPGVSTQFCITLT